MNLRMLKKSMSAYVSAVKFIWSSMAYPLSIVGKKFMNLRGYRVYGNSVQDGTPSPEYPSEIESVGDLSTKNLLDKTSIITGTRLALDGNLISKDNDSVPLETETMFASEYIETEPNKNLTFSINMYGYKHRLCYYDQDKKFITVNGTDTNTVTTPDNTKYIRFNGYLSEVDTFMLEEGTTATEYEPYHKYKIPVVARGKNLATAQQVYSNASNYSECTEDGRNCIRCTSAGKSYAGINFKTNTQYTVRFEAKTVVRSSYEEDGSPEALFAFTHTDGTRKVIAVNGSKDWAYYEATSLANKTIASVGMYPYNYKHWIYVNVDTFQIEEGTTATTYEPYIAPVTTNIFLDKPLRKVGDYADYVDFEKQKVVRNVSRTDSLRALATYYYKDLHGIVTDSILKYDSSRLKGMSNRLNVFTDNGNETCTFLLGINNRRICWVGILDVLGIYSDSKTKTEMIEEFNTWLAENPTYVIYPLTIPIEETVNLPALPQFKGTTIYEVGTNIKPSGMEAKYC